MTPVELQNNLRGVLAFTPTPFTAADTLDGDGLARHVDFLCRSGVHAVFVCGGVGEFFALDAAEYRACIRIAVEAAARRVPVIAGIGHDTRTACNLAAYAEKVGADGLLVHPFYFAAPPDDGIVRHYRALASASTLGMVVYHTKEALYTPALLSRLAEIPSLAALKDEVGDLKTFGEMREQLGDRLAWIDGMAELLVAPYLAAGAQAMTTGIVNFAPALSLAVWETGVAEAGGPSASQLATSSRAHGGAENGGPSASQLATSSRAHGGAEDGGPSASQLATSSRAPGTLNDLLAHKIRPLARLRERRKGYAIAVVKEAMNLLGLPGGTVRLPLLPMLPADREELRELLGHIGLL
jgi:5-dehydro-4-deoxyglucarate dehydratase